MPRQASDAAAAERIPNSLRSEAASAAQRALRVLFDGRPPGLLFERIAAGPELAHVEIDERGWVLIASSEPGEPAHVVVVLLGGGAAAEWTVPGRVFGAALGP